MQLLELLGEGEAIPEVEGDGRSRLRRRVELHVMPVDRGSPDDSRAIDDRDQLERGFRRLSAEQRALIVLHHFVGLPLAETADSLGLPLGTVKSRLFRATQTMRAALDADARASGLVEEHPA